MVVLDALRLAQCTLAISAGRFDGRHGLAVTPSSRRYGLPLDCLPMYNSRPMPNWPAARLHASVTPILTESSQPVASGTPSMPAASDRVIVPVARRES